MHFQGGREGSEEVVALFHALLIGLAMISFTKEYYLMFEAELTCFCGILHRIVR
jgi:hypothetical protein